MDRRAAGNGLHGIEGTRQATSCAYDRVGELCTSGRLQHRAQSESSHCCGAAANTF